MYREQAHATINRLVESYHDRHTALTCLTQFKASTEPPGTSGESPNLGTFLETEPSKRTRMLRANCGTSFRQISPFTTITTVSARSSLVLASRSCAERFTIDGKR
jgi:hypothetical protein